MSDLISRKATIDTMEDVDWYHINKDGQLTHGANSKEDEPLYKAEDVYKVLNDMPSAQPQWIPCSERLPEKAEERYWVCTNTGYQCQCRWTNDVYGLGSDGEWAWKIFDIPQYSHVVAWMPLPEPLEEGENR